MGCDIHSYVEQLDAEGRWQNVDTAAPFDWRSYSVFGFLADVRNYSAVTPIDEPRGLPDDLSPDVAEAWDYWRGDAHSATWLTVHELAAFDYDQEVNDRRITRNGDGGVTGSPEEGEVTTYRRFLGEAFDRDVERLRGLGDPERVRVVLWFDN